MPFGNNSFALEGLAHRLRDDMTDYNRTTLCAATRITMQFLKFPLNPDLELPEIQTATLYRSYQLTRTASLAGSLNLLKTAQRLAQVSSSFSGLCQMGSIFGFLFFRITLAIEYSKLSHLSWCLLL